MTDPDAAAAARAVTDILAHTAALLGAAGARDEALATLKPGRGIGPFKTAPALVSAGRAWRLGVLLLDRDGRLYSTGHVTRAIEPKNFSADKTVAGEERRAEQRAAARGAFVIGEVVNFGFSEIAVDAASLEEKLPPLLLQHGSVIVRTGEGATVALASYLADRAALLIESS